MDLKGKRCLVLGFGREGRACLGYLLSHGVKDISVADSGNLQDISSEYPDVREWHIGTSWSDAIDSCDIILKSPGIPFRYVANFKGPILSATQIFLDTRRDRTIAITGTKGKSTSASLLQHILNEIGVNSVLGGNIGIPPLDMIEIDADVYVLELSSYQLEVLSVSPRIGVVLNIYPDHLDHHETFEAYRDAKLRIGKFQNESDVFIAPFTRKDDFSGQLPVSSVKRWSGGRGSCAFNEGHSLFVRDDEGKKMHLTSHGDLPVKGKGMLENVCAVLECISAAYTCGLIQKPEWVRIGEALKTFQPLPHRMQEIRGSSGILFINDSISTIPEATINALEVYGDSVETLILGGFDRGISYDVLLKYLPSTKVKNLIFLPPAGTRMQGEIESGYSDQYQNITSHNARDMTHAVELAYQNTTASKVCLLSPAAPSFGMFKNFEERGEVFMSLVESTYSEL